jgi:hypothetical protein
MAPLVAAVEAALARDDRGAVEVAVHKLCEALTRALDVPPVEVEILEVRPSTSDAELHGLYTYEDDEAPCIRVWMRTAARAQTVKFRTFLRTVVHELCHHLDLELLGLEVSFHTEGFFKRESSLFHQLLPTSREG